MCVQIMWGTMSSLKETCCVCLNLSDNCCKLNNEHEAESLLFKLQNVIPEVEWLDNYYICGLCTSQLESAYEFRLSCLKLDLNRKTALSPKIIENFTCYHCNEDFNDKEVLIEHISTHQSKSTNKTKIKKSKPKKRNFSCEVCNMELKHAKLIIQHCVSDHSMLPKSVKPYTCDECPMRFTSSSNLVQHKKYHSGSRCHICSFCGKSYITKNDLTVHEYTHFNRRNYKCEFCAKAFNTNKNLRSHILVVHTDQNLWKFNCGLCNRRFPQKSGYEQHMKRHSGEKPFTCHICNKSFVTKSELQKHVKYHSVVKPFKCDYCDKAYKEKRLYNVHLAKTHGIGEVKISKRL